MCAAGELDIENWITLLSPGFLLYDYDYDNDNDSDTDA
jgi:hypothetical protein